MKRFNEYSTEGVRRLIMAVAEDMDLTELQRLVLETRSRIPEEWRGYPKGLRKALIVFDELSIGRYDAEIAVRHGVSREMVRLIHERLFKLKCVRELKAKLKAIKSADEQ